MSLKLTAAARNARLDAITTALGATATLKVYDGTPPANADAALSGNTLLGTLNCSNPVAPAASGGVLTFSSVTQDSAADATGTASFFRALAGATVVLQGTCGTSGADMILNTTSIVTGGPIQVSSVVITDGNA